MVIKINLPAVKMPAVAVAGSFAEVDRKMDYLVPSALIVLE